MARDKLVAALAVVALAAAVSAAGAEATRSAATPPKNTAPPTITGTAQEGSTLTAAPGSWSGTAPIAYAYAWERCDKHGANCKEIDHAGSTSYSVSSHDVGHTIRVLVNASNSAGSAQATSSATAVVAGAQQPNNTSPPSISGAALEGSVLSASAGSWSGTAPITYDYRWRRCGPGGGNCNGIDGARGSTYKLTADDVERTVRVKVIASNSAGSSDATSAPTALVDGPPALDHRPSVTGNAAIGGHLSAGNGTWRSVSHITYTFRWLRCDASGKNCGAISGATAPLYTVTTADAGHTLTFDVTAHNARGATTATALASAVIGTPPPSTGTVPVSNVAPPDRLIVDRLTWSPPRIRSRQQALVGRFHVSEVLHGRPVSDALVYAIGIPFGELSQPQEVLTGSDGWATVVFNIRPSLPLRRGNFVVVFVRARKPGDNILAGISTRRLVSVQIG